MKRFKCFILSCMFIVMTGSLFCQNFDLKDFSFYGGPPAPYSLKFIDSNKLLVSWYKEGGNGMYEKEYTYTEKKIGAISIYTLNEPLPENLYVGWGNPDSKFEPYKSFILLTGKTQYAVDDEETTIALCLFPKQNNLDSGIFFEKFPVGGSGEYYLLNLENATSHLTEGKTEYKIKNIMTMYNSWAEGVDGWGIGESFEVDSSDDQEHKYMVVMNGFISADNPNLYYQNGRIKKLKVTGLKSGKEKILTLKDTPHPQSIDIHFLEKGEDIKFTIADVYKGTLYQDTCLSFMTSWYKEVIPYK